MKKVVLDGGPGTGKTSIVKLLRKKGYRVFDEVARDVLSHHRRFKKPTKSQIVKIQQEIWDKAYRKYRRLTKSKHKGITFLDRGFVGSLAYYELSGLKISKDKKWLADEAEYHKVFMIDPLPKEFYQNDKVRKEDYRSSKKIHTLIRNTYKKFGHKVINVPFGTVEERVKFILKKLK